MPNEPEFLTRRRFFAALAASVIVAGLPLPVGMSAETAVIPMLFKYTWNESMTLAWFRWECGEVRGEMPVTFSNARKAA